VAYYRFRPTQRVCGLGPRNKFMPGLVSYISLLIGFVAGAWWAGGRRYGNDAVLAGAARPFARDEQPYDQD
jgi:hypothetical protein